MRRYVFRLAILSLFVLTHGTVWAGDQEIAQQIIEKLQAEKKAGSLKGFSIDLQVDEGTVWLSGRVASEQQQARALDLARRVSGVKQVVNDLSIAPAKVAGAARKPTSTPTAAPAQMGANEYYAGMVNEEAAPSSLSGHSTPSRQAAVEQPASTLSRSTQPEAAPAAPAAETVAEQPRFAFSEQVAPPTIAVEAVPIETAQVEASPIEVAPLEVAAEPAPLQRPVVRSASVRQQVAAATGSTAIGSGVDATSNLVHAAQPVANIPQPVATPEPLQQFAAQPATAQPQQVAPHQVAMVPMQMPYMVPVYAGSTMQVPLAMAPARPVNYNGGPVAMQGGGAAGAPVPMYMPGSGVGIAPARYDHPSMPGYAWPSYAAYPNYAAVTYPKQYSPTAWPYIGPFYPYPQVPLGWRKVTMEWDDGWWMLDFKDRRTMYNH